MLSLIWDFFFVNRNQVVGFLVFVFFFKGKAGHCKGLGVILCFVSFILKQYKVIEQMVLCRIMNTSQVSHSETLQLFCFGFQMNINMIYIGTNIVMHHVTKPSSAMALILLTL